MREATRKLFFQWRSVNCLERINYGNCKKNACEKGSFGQDGSTQESIFRQDGDCWQIRSEVRCSCQETHAESSFYEGSGIEP